MSKTIAVVLPQVDNNFFAMSIKGIQSVAHKRDYHVLLYLTFDDPDKEISIFQLLESGRVDGIIVSAVNKDDNIAHFNEVISRGKPVIFFDRICAEIEATKITTDDVQSAYKATELLIKRGCKKIAYMHVLRDFSIGKRRFAGYILALKDYNIQFDESLVLKGTQDYDSNYQLIKKLLKSKNRPDGILSPVEKMAITSYYVCEELKLKIPDDIKIASFTNLSFASLLSPALTTIVPPAYEMGVKAATLLLNSFEKKQNKLLNEEIIIPSTIYERASTKSR